MKNIKITSLSTISRYFVYINNNKKIYIHEINTIEAFLDFNLTIDKIYDL